MQARLVKTSVEFPDRIFCLGFSPNGSILASINVSVGNAAKFLLWDGSSLNQIGELAGNQPLSFAFFPDSKVLASSDSGNVHFWDVATKRKLVEFKPRCAPKSIAVSPDGSTIAFSSFSDCLCLWDSAMVKELKTTRLYGNSLTFSPDGKALAVATETMISLRDAQTLEEKHRFKRHRQEITSVVFSPDGALLASGSKDSTVKIWDIATGQEIRNLKGHKFFVNCVSFSPDGCFVAAGANWEARIWNWQAETVTATMPVSPDQPRFSVPGLTAGFSPGSVSPEVVAPAVATLAFHPDGRTVALGTHSLKTLTTGPRAGKDSGCFSTLQLWEINSG